MSTFFIYVLNELIRPLLDSDIISASALGTNIVVIDTVPIALELMDKRSSRYSSRYGHRGHLRWMLYPI